MYLAFISSWILFAASIFSALHALYCSGVGKSDCAVSGVVKASSSTTEHQSLAVEFALAGVPALAGYVFQILNVTVSKAMLELTGIVVKYGPELQPIILSPEEIVSV